MVDARTRKPIRSTVKTGVATYAVLALGFALITVGMQVFSRSPVGGFFSGSLVVVTLGVMLAPVLAVVLGLRHATDLADHSLAVTYATTAATNGLGVLAVYVVGGLFAYGGATPNTPIVSQLTGTVGPILVGAIGAAFAGVGTVWAVRRLPAGPASDGATGEQAETTRTR